MADYFQNIYDSHDHSMRVLELLTAYDSFMDSLTVIADMGAGAGIDINWWATLQTRDEEPQPYNYVCYAVDTNVSQLDGLPENVTVLEQDFETVKLPKKADVIWCHDSFQYTLNPLATLKNWNEQMNVNGMLLLVLPQTSNHEYNRFMNRVYDYQYFNYNVCNLLYMLAVNGFDCKDSYMYKAPNDPWIHLAVYKTDIPPMDPRTTRWVDLDEMGLLHKSLSASIQKYGFLRQEDIVLQWLDKNLYFVRD